MVFVMCLSKFLLKFFGPESFSRKALLTEGKMGDNTGKDECCQEGEREDEGIEVSIVALPYAVTHPRAVVIKSFWKIKGKSDDVKIT